MDGMNFNENALEIAETDIAIIGMAGQFPGANNIEEYWENLKAGRESIKFFSDEELQAAGVPSYLLKRPNYVKAAGVLADADLFDAAFFGFSPKEAQIIDPQHRLFLEQSATALEHAGYNPHTYRGAIAVYAGVGMNTYLLESLYPTLLTSPELDSYQVQIRNDKDFLPTLVSYKLNLRGPSLSVQTACSTSLVATHIACQSLLNGECDMALAGGVTVFANPTGYLYTEGMILSPDGHCRTFDAQAQGTVVGNGVGVVVLKRLTDAIAERDTIHAVIKGSAVNNDGTAKVGYTAPSVEGQAAVIAEAQAIAGTPADTITYVEAHGTGTTLGDPIEITALTQAFRHTTANTQYCAIGSVKPNVGHLDTAAGVTSLIKVALALKHKTLPPSINFTAPNPTINFAQSPFFVNTQLTDWQPADLPRRAGVSSFGIGGTNVHMVLEEAPAIASSPSQRPDQRQAHLLVLSAKTESALQQQQQNLAAHLRSHLDLALADVAFTLAQGRQAFAHRRICLAQSLPEAIQLLETPTPQSLHTIQTDRPAVVFLFPGQGSQSVNMGRDLYAQEPVFQETLDRCADLLLPHLGQDIREVLYPGDREAQPAQIHQTQYAQPILFAVEYALAQLWLSWGIQPEAMVGHSLGEYVAACLAEVFSLEDGLRLVADRAKLMQTLPPGAMLAIPGTEAEIQPWLSHEIFLATANGSVCTVSGTLEAIARLEAQLTEAGITATRLQTSHAFHSPLVEPIVHDFRQLLSRVKFHAPERAYLSNVTSTWITAAEATDPEYWVNHLRQTVRFGDAIAQLLVNPDWIFLEIGSGQTLTALIRRHPIYHAQPLLNSLTASPNSTLEALGQLWLRGLSCKWNRFYRHEPCHRIPLPTYPFERQRYWIDPPQGGLGASSFGLSRNPDPSRWFYTPSWKQLPALPRQPLPPAQCWLIFLDEMGVGAALAEYLTQAGQTAVTVACGDRWWTQKANHTIDPTHPDSLLTLLKDLQAQNLFPHQIVHLWELTKPIPGSPKLDSLAEQQDRGLYLLLAIAQAIGKLGQPYPTQLSVLVNGVYNILGTEPLNPLKSTLLGAVKVIPQEYPQVQCRLIDLGELYAKPAAQRDWLHNLLTDLTTSNAPIESAYRGRSRWCPIYEPIVLPEAQQIPKLRSKGVYLITGGLGGIGLTLAQYLARTVQARLVLVSRSALPDRHDWSNWCLTHAAEDPTRRKIEQILEMESWGAKVWLAPADVTDLPALQKQIVLAEAAMGHIQGIIHCAGVVDFAGIIQGRKRRDTDRILASKVTGTLALDYLFRDRTLDFWVFSSSLSTVLYKTLFGQVGYGAANEFLGAFCEAKQANQTPAISIHWTEWDQVGMAVSSREDRLKNKARAQEDDNWLVSLTPEEGAEAFARILNQSQSRIIVSAQDLNVLLQQQSQWSTDQLLESLALEPDANQVKQARPDLPTPYVAPQTQLEEMILQQWETYLGIAPLGLRDNFYDLGGDSLLALGLLAQIQKKLTVTIPMIVLLETPTVGGLVAYLQAQTPEAIAQWLTPLALPINEPISEPVREVLLVEPPIELQLEPPAEPPIELQLEPPAEPPIELQLEPPAEPPIELQLEPPAEPPVEPPSFLASPKPPIPPLNLSLPIANPIRSNLAPQPAEPAELSEPLVIRLQQGNPDHPPLFFVHPIGGGISCYAPLMRYLNPEQGFYGLRAIGLEDHSTPIEDITLMAKTYVKAIQKIQPTGSYYLGGWSMGGVVAYEMALQLRQAHAIVNAVILIDSPAPIVAKRNISDDFTIFTRGLGFAPEHVKPLGKFARNRPQDMDEPLSQLLVDGQKLGVLPKGFTLEALKRLYSVFSAHSLALSRYKARSCPEPLPTLYLQAQTPDPAKLNLRGEQAVLVWQQLLGRSLFAHRLPGDHYSLVVEPQVATLTTYINTFLRQAKLLKNPSSFF